MMRISCKDIMRWTYLSVIITISFSFDVVSGNKDGYYGKFIGKLTEFHHGVSGEVYAVDARTLHLRNFNYDGEGPAAYFYVGNSKGPGVNGIRIRDERGTTNVLPKYRNKHITLTLPDGKTLQNIRWFSVWCDEFSVNFGDVRINKNFDFPRPQKISGLSGVHGVSSDPIVIVDAQTLLIPNFSYDGEAPDAKFWVGRGFKPSPQGIRLPDENGKYIPLRQYDRKTIVLTLPGDLTIFDIGHFGVWCEAFTVDFGHVQIPSGLNVPPSLKMLGVSPQKRSRSLAVPLNAQIQFGSQEPGVQSLNNQIFYQDLKAQNSALQDIRPTTYRPQIFRPVQQQPLIDNFQIQRSISLSSNNEFVINEQTGDFVKKPLDIQHSRREEVRYEPTPAEKILQHNPAEPGTQPIFQNNGFLFTPQTTAQPRPQFFHQPQRQTLPAPPVHFQQFQQSQPIIRHPQPQIFQPQGSQFVQPQQFVQQPQQFVQHQQPQIIRQQPQFVQQQQHLIRQQHFPQQQQQQQAFVPQQQFQIQQPQFVQQPSRLIHYQQQQQIIPQNNVVHHQQFFQQQPRQLPLIQPPPQQFIHPQQPTHFPQPNGFQRRSSQHLGPAFQQNLQPNINHAPFNRFDFNTRGRRQYHHRFSKLNCEVLWDQLAFEVRWAVAGDSIVLQLVAKLENGEYMSFGLSGDDTKSQMVGGDVTVAWVDKDTLKGHAFDYYLDAKSQCSGGRGSCPDDKILERSNSVRLLNAALVNGYSIVTYQRSLKPQDELDRQIFTNGSQPIIWAIGPLNSLEEVSYHSLANRGNVFIDFGRSPQWNCPTPESNTQSDPEESSTNQNQQPAQFNKQQRVSTDVRQQGNTRQDTRTRVQVPTPAPAPKANAWYIPPIQCHEPEDGVFYAQMGPTGGKRGYPAITGHVGWGISWYINGLLIPEINVVRGRTYTFIVEGGLDPEIPARYHPFYITDDPVGGYEHKTPEERANIQIFAGAVQNKRGEVRPTGVGRLCNWTPDPKQPPADEFASFGAYQRTLRLECDQGEPGIIQWTVDRDTPDTVYYQCYTHRYLGWKINVLDHCDTEGAGSNPVPSIVKAPADFLDKYAEDFDEIGQESVIHSTKVKPEFGLKNGGGHDKNKTHALGNDFVKYQPQITYVPEFSFYNEDTGEPISPDLVSKIKSQKEIAQLKAQYALKDPLIKQQAMQLGPQVFHVQKVVPQQKIIPLDMSQMKNEDFINFFHVAKEQNGPHNHKVELVLGKDQKPDIRGPNLRLKQDLQEIPSIQVDSVRIPEELKKDEKFNEEFLKNYQLLKVQAEENVKKHKQKIQLYNKPSNRLPNGHVIAGQNRLQFANVRKPSQHAVTLQQRPLPPGMFRPPFLPPPMAQKRPAFVHAAQIPHRLTRVPQKQVLKQEPSKAEIHQYVNLQKQLESLGDQFEAEIEASKGSPIIHLKHSKQENVPLAVNTGFNPDSVKVEGGFKPILNTGIAPKYKIIDRADENVDEDAEDKVGVIDLTKQDSLGEKDALFEDANEELIVDDVKDKTTEELDLFRNQKPQMFEPIFIPSPPDNRIQKYQEKHKKKPITKYHDLSMKYRSDQLQYYNTNKNNNYYIKIRPRPNLIRRPLYPDNVVPPFKIPVRGGTPQLRYQQPEDAVEDTTDFDIIQMINDTSSPDDSKAENILEILEMGEGKSSENGTGEGSGEKLSGANATEDELAMADSLRDFYLPGKVLTYDGKMVRAEPAPSIPVQSNPDISKLPQFGPFRGETPPLTTKNLKQVTVTKTATQDILPPDESAKLGPVPKSDETKVEIHNESEIGKINHGVREKRSPDHEPGHVGPHDHHNHHHHTNGASNLLIRTLPSLILFSALRFL